MTHNTQTVSVNTKMVTHLIIWITHSMSGLLPVTKTVAHITKEMTGNLSS